MSEKNQTFEEVYKTQIQTVFGKEFYKHALVINSILILFSFLLCIFFSDLQNKFDLFLQKSKDYIKSQDIDRSINNNSNNNSNNSNNDNDNSNNNDKNNDE